ncbi:hypothetical protein [Streptomyces sp. NPDC002685]|uniref:hypothetical protein n=1 Tax=Streptomyces sp. NPDC002685 TaxID=3154540 RepID=UPI003328EDB2
MDALTRRDLLEWDMAESVPVRCPACRREHLYAAPSYPCVCGAPVTPPLDRLAEPTPVTHRTWDDDWAAVRCDACDREIQWPHPELGCPCGTTLRIPVRAVREVRGAAEVRGERAVRRPGHTETAPSTADPARGDDTGGENASPGRIPDGGQVGEQGRDAGVGAARDAGPGDGPGAARDDGPGEGDASAGRRPAFQPVTIRTARDAVTVAALYLRWLGYRDIRRADQRPPSGIGLAARGILAQVDPTVRPASLRDVECLWLTAMTESSDCVFFSLAGYADDARVRADSLGVPLFVLDLTGTPRPVNSLADELAASGA